MRDMSNTYYITFFYTDSKIPSRKPTNYSHMICRAKSTKEIRSIVHKCMERSVRDYLRGISNEYIFDAFIGTKTSPTGHVFMLWPSYVWEKDYLEDYFLYWDGTLGEKVPRNSPQMKTRIKLAKMGY